MSKLSSAPSSSPSTSLATRLHLSPRCSDVLLALGALTVARFAFRGAKLLYRTCLRGRSSNLRRYQAPSGDGWALVTGCTSGLGEAFAFELARRGFHVMLVARNAQKLQEVSDAIRKLYPQTITRIVVSDAAATGDAGAAAIEAVRSAAAEVPLRVLINNVGVLDDNRFVEQTVSAVQEMINVNVAYTTLLTHALLPQLQREASATASARTAVLNVSSQCGVFGVPFYSVYSATKSYLIGLSHSLREELRHDNSAAGGSGRVDVSSYTPSRLCTRMTGIETPSFFVPSAQSCAVAALDQLGARDFAGVASHALLLEVGEAIDAESRGKLEYKEVEQVVINKKKKLAAAAAVAAQ